MIFVLLDLSKTHVCPCGAPVLRPLRGRSQNFPRGSHAWRGFRCWILCSLRFSAKSFLSFFFFFFPWKPSGADAELAFALCILVLPKKKKKKEAALKIISVLLSEVLVKGGCGVGRLHIYLKYICINIYIIIYMHLCVEVEAYIKNYKI